MWHVWISSLGVTAAIILAGGYVVLQMQRDRHRFQLALAALEHGVSNSPAGPPYWLTSLRQGVAILVLGLGLMVVGAVANHLASGIAPPSAASLAEVAAAAERPDELPPAPPREGKPHPPPPHHPKPPPPNPALEAWHQAQRQQAVGLITLAGGFLITLLGVVRTGFALAERKSSSSADIPPP